jgi:hypothetical protein
MTIAKQRQLPNNDNCQTTIAGLRTLANVELKLTGMVLSVNGNPQRTSIVPVPKISMNGLPSQKPNGLGRPKAAAAATIWAANTGAQLPPK